MSDGNKRTYRAYRIETYMADGSRVVSDTTSDSDWRAVDTLFYTALAMHGCAVHAFCLLKQRDDGTWGRIARIMMGDGETVEEPS